MMNNMVLYKGILSTGLVEFYLYDYLKESSRIDVVFAEAFHMVHKNLLLNKLSQIDVLGVMMSWFRSYLISVR